jgi:Brp/Blh family beta-carotene 15,15'-monooxygenase
MKLYTFIFEFLLLGILALLFSKSTLLFGFGFYFVLWHSLPSLNSQLSYIYNNKTKRPFIQYIKSALVYWILALIGLSIFYFYLDVSETQYLSIFFSFLAAITFPHAVVMGLMFQSRESNGY